MLTRFKRLRSTKGLKALMTTLGVVAIPIFIALFIYLLANIISTDRRITRLEQATPCALHKIVDCRKTIEGFLSLLTPSEKERLASELFQYLPAKKGHVTIVKRIVLPGKNTITRVGGAVGQVGARGLEGPRGASGPQGRIGSQGTRGIRGIRGPQGPQGLRGPIGARGPQGARGRRGLPGSRGPQGLRGPIPTLSEVCAALHLPPGVCHRL